MEAYEQFLDGFRYGFVNGWHDGNEGEYWRSGLSEGERLSRMCEQMFFTELERRKVLSSYIVARNIIEQGSKAIIGDSNRANSFGRDYATMTIGKFMWKYKLN